MTVRSPSLHNIDGKSYPLEIDVVHTLVKGEQDKNELAVVTLLFEATQEETPFFENFNPKNKDDFEISLKSLIKGDKEVFYY